MILKPKMPSSMLRRPRLPKTKPLRKKRRQVTCVCDLWWFPHRYVFSKCPPRDVWDEIAIDLGFKIKLKGRGNKAPF